jgi:hypothetical protein
MLCEGMADGRNFHKEQRENQRFFSLKILQCSISFGNEPITTDLLSLQLFEMKAVVGDS